MLRAIRFRFCTFSTLPNLFGREQDCNTPANR
jgi:hypothetical protein